MLLNAKVLCCVLTGALLFGPTGSFAAPGSHAHKGKHQSRADRITGALANAPAKVLQISRSATYANPPWTELESYDIARVSQFMQVIRPQLTECAIDMTNHRLNYGSVFNLASLTDVQYSEIGLRSGSERLGSLNELTAGISAGIDECRDQMAHYNQYHRTESYNKAVTGVYSALAAYVGVPHVLQQARTQLP